MPLELLIVCGYHKHDNAESSFLFHESATMTESHDSGKTEQDLLAAEQSGIAEPMPTVIVPGEAAESLPPGSSTPEPDTVATVHMEELPSSDNTFVMTPQSDSGRTLISGIDPTLDDNALKPGGTRAAKVSVRGYQILGELGRGGMGVVYRARHTGLNRTVAIKMIIAGGHAASEQMVRFRAEA